MKSRALLAVLLAALLSGDLAMAQTSPAPTDTTRIDPQALGRRIEALVRGGQRDEAIALLERQDERAPLSANLRRRLARLYRDSSRWGDVEATIVAGGPEEALDIGQLRLLAEARYELGRPGEGRRTLERILEVDPSDASLLRLVANVLGQRDETADAIELLRQGRVRLGQPLEFAQTLARLHAQLGLPVEAAREYCRVIAASPLNVSLMRGQILELADRHPDLLVEMLEGVDGVAAENPLVPQIQLVSAELLLRIGDGEGAWQRLVPLLVEPSLSQELLRMALAGLADSRLPDAPAERTLDRLRLSVRLSRGLLGNETLPASLQPRVYDTLVRSLLGMLENDAFSRMELADQASRVEELRETIVDMQRAYPGNRMTLTAVLRLAEVYGQSLAQPRQALDLYRAITLDPSAPKEQVQIAQIGLARSHIAVGDTATARVLFEQIGQDMDFIDGQGRAQYHLGLLDFMGGDYETALDRFKAVAAEQPRADYTNEALDLAVLLVEQEMSPVPDEEGLAAYGRVLYLRETLDGQGLRTVLGQLDGGAATPLRDRARWDLAQLDRRVGRLDSAWPRLDRLVRDAPTSRYAPSALESAGDVLAEMGRGEDARARWERLLLDYDDYVMIDRVRDRLRELAATPDSTEEGELP